MRVFLYFKTQNLRILLHDKNIPLFTILVIQPAFFMPLSSSSDIKVTKWISSQNRKSNYDERKSTEFKRPAIIQTYKDDRPLTLVSIITDGARRKPQMPDIWLMTKSVSLWRQSTVTGFLTQVQSLNRIPSRGDSRVIAKHSINRLLLRKKNQTPRIVIKILN